MIFAILAYVNHDKLLITIGCLFSSSRSLNTDRICGPLFQVVRYWYGLVWGVLIPMFLFFREIVAGMVCNQKRVLVVWWYLTGSAWILLILMKALQSAWNFTMKFCFITNAFMYSFVQLTVTFLLKYDIFRKFFRNCSAHKALDSMGYISEHSFFWGANFYTPECRLI